MHTKSKSKRLNVLNYLVFCFDVNQEILMFSCRTIYDFDNPVFVVFFCKLKKRIV
jgi:hypothetical protein